MATEKKKQQGKGEARKAGRAPLYGEERLVEKVPTRCNQAQAQAVVAYCHAKGCNLNLFFREAALKCAGVSQLGSGLEACYNSQRENKPRVPPGKAGLQIPVKFTARQYTALKAHCTNHGGIPLATFVRDAGLIEAGHVELTRARQYQQRAQYLGKATEAGA